MATPYAALAEACILKDHHAAHQQPLGTQTVKLTTAGSTALKASCLLVPDNSKGVAYFGFDS